MLYSKLLKLVVFLFQGAGFNAIVQTIQLHTSDLKLLDSEHAVAPKNVALPTDEGLKRIMVLRHPFARAVSWFMESIGLESRGHGVFWNTFDEWLTFMEATKGSQYLDREDDPNRPCMRTAVIVGHPSRPDGYAVERLRPAMDLIALAGVSPNEFTLLRLEGGAVTMQTMGFATFAPIDETGIAELWTIERESRLRAMFSDDYTLGGYGIFSH